MREKSGQFEEKIRLAHEGGREGGREGERSKARHSPRGESEKEDGRTDLQKDRKVREGGGGGEEREREEAHHNNLHWQAYAVCAASAPTTTIRISTRSEESYRHVPSDWGAWARIVLGAMAQTRPPTRGMPDTASCTRRAVKRSNTACARRAM